MKEVFKDIKGYEGFYQVSNLGNVKSLDYRRTGKEKVLKPALNGRGYFFIVLCKNGKCKEFKIHRLVAQAFISNPNNLPQVNHKDEVKTNNHVDNLEWCTNKYNLNYGTHNKRMAKTLSKFLTGKYNTKKSKAVLQYDRQEKFIRKYPSTMEVQRLWGYLNGYISACCRGERRTAYGYIWKYKF